MYAINSEWLLGQMNRQAAPVATNRNQIPQVISVAAIEKHLGQLAFADAVGITFAYIFGRIPD